jgi:hypothetical protein
MAVEPDCLFSGPWPFELWQHHQCTSVIMNEVYMLPRPSSIVARRPLPTAPLVLSEAKLWSHLPLKKPPGTHTPLQPLGGPVHRWPH